MPSHKRQKRLPAYFNFSDALLPHVAPIALERGAGAVTGHSGAAVSRSRQTRTAEEYRTDPTNAPGLHTPVGVPLSGGSDSDFEGGDDSDTSALSDGVADWSGAEDMDFSSDEEEPAGGLSSRREFVCFGYLFGRSRVSERQYDVMREAENAFEPVQPWPSRFRLHKIRKEMTRFAAPVKEVKTSRYVPIGKGKEPRR